MRILLSWLRSDDDKMTMVVTIGYERAVLWVEKGHVSGRETLPLSLQNIKRVSLHLLYNISLPQVWMSSVLVFACCTLPHPLCWITFHFSFRYFALLLPLPTVTFISLSKIGALTQTFRRGETFLFRFLVARFCFMLLSLAFASSRRFKTFFPFSVLSS